MPRSSSDRPLCPRARFAGGRWICSRPGGTLPEVRWTPPESQVIVTVRTIDQLRRAVERAKPGSTVLLEDGVYHLNGSRLEIQVRGLILRGRKGERARVGIRGRGMDERMEAIFVNAPDVTLADLTISNVGFHAIHVRGGHGTSGVVIHNVHILNIGQQLIKGSKAPGDKPCRNGLVACSRLEYSDHAPSDYTNGVDIHNAEGWVVRDNTLRRIRGPRAQNFRAGPAILFWGGSRDTIVERRLDRRLLPRGGAGVDSDTRKRP